MQLGSFTKIYIRFKFLTFNKHWNILYSNYISFFRKNKKILGMGDDPQAGSAGLSNWVMRC